MMQVNARKRHNMKLLAFAAIAIVCVKPEAHGQVPAEHPSGSPSFMMPGDIFCTDQLDFDAWQKMHHFHSRGGEDSCLMIEQVTRAIELQRYSEGDARIMITQGPYEYFIGWTNAALPLVK